MHVWLVRLAILFGLLTLAPAFALAAWDDGWDTKTFRTEVEALGTTSVTNFPIPVLVGVELVNLKPNFGESRGGGTRTHEGLDIVAPQGTPFASPTDAVITSSGNGSDSGLYIRTAVPGGETFVYMHLSKIADGIAPGVVVKRGDIIGFVGNTGNASGGGAHLHFEIRKNGAQNPYPRLTSTFSAEEREKGLLQAAERGGGAVASATTNTPATKTDVATAAAEITAATNAALAHASIAFGETNDKIFTLQNFLIANSAGEASAKLKNNGATGYFGPLTVAALREYQRTAGLEQSGVVDSSTYIKVFASSATPTPLPSVEPASAASTTTATKASFTRNLEVGVEGDDVMALQQFLNTHGFEVAAEGPGSRGQETTRFGALTRAAVVRYQQANSIAPAIGYFGPKTRVHVSTLASR